MFSRLKQPFKPKGTVKAEVRGRDTAQSKSPSPIPPIPVADPESIDEPPVQRGANLGLQALYQPADSSKAIVDIVFLHGITGNAYSTWCDHKSGTHWPSALLKEDIPDARILCFGYDADVSSFWGHASKNRLGEHARDLLGDLAREREDTDTQDRKIVFIAHSLGGLVVDKALSVSRSRAEAHLRTVERCTIGIAYLGTPHNGSDLAAWAIVCTKLVRKFKDANPEIVGILTRDSEILRDTQDGFGQLLETRKNQGSKINITCFYEELAVPAVGQVVSMSSAVLLGCDSYGIHANHMDMTRFAARTDVGYKRILGELKRWIKPLRSVTEPQLALPVGTEFQELREECLRTLHYDDMSSRQDAVELAHGSTFTWIWSRGDLGFRDWLQTGHGIYWISGKPGSGKSTMMKYLAEDTERISNELSQSHIEISSGRIATPVIARHFFYFRASSLARSIEGLIRSLLWQILSQQRSLFQVVAPEFLQMKRLRSNFAWTRHDLELVLRKVFDALDEFQVCLFIDALDEYDGEDCAIARFLDELIKRVPASVRFCLASRPYPDFSFQFVSAKGFKIHEETATDIRAYVRERYQEVISTRGPSFQSLMEATLEKAEGVFLWVKLVCDDLQRGWRRFESLPQLRQRLKDTPKDLSSLYQRIFDDMEDDEREEAKRMLAIVISASRPLDLIEFNYALKYSILDTSGNEKSPHQSLGTTEAIRSEFSFYEEGGYNATEQLEAAVSGRVDAVCRGLIQVQQKRPRLLHETVDAFLRRASLDLQKAEVPQRYPNGDSLLLTACIQFQMDVFERDDSLKWTLTPEFPQKRVDDQDVYIDLGSVKLNSVDFLQRSQDYGWPSNLLLRLNFLQYSILEWLFHAKRTDTGDENWELLNLFSGYSFAIWRRLIQILYPSQGRSLPVEFLETAIESGLSSCCAKGLALGGTSEKSDLTPNRRLDVNRDDGRLLFAVAKSGDLTVARLLLTQGASFEPNRLLLLGPQIQHRRLNSFARQSQGGPLRHYGQSALHRAIFCAHPRLVQLFLEHGADRELELDSKNLDEWLRLGGRMTMRTLGDSTRGLSVHASIGRRNAVSVRRRNEGNPWTNRPLEFAVHYRFNNNEVFDVILASYPYGKPHISLHYALTAAAFHGLDSYVKKLLDHGADPSAVVDRPRGCIKSGTHTCCALLPAVYRGNVAIANLLLASGASPNYATKCGSGAQVTPLQIALERWESYVATESSAGIAKAYLSISWELFDHGGRVEDDATSTTRMESPEALSDYNQVEDKNVDPEDKFRAMLEFRRARAREAQKRAMEERYSTSPNAMRRKNSFGEGGLAEPIVSPSIMIQRERKFS